MSFLDRHSPSVAFAGGLSVTGTPSILARLLSDLPQAASIRQIVSATIDVPDHLRASGSPHLLPVFDIVWTGDPSKDRTREDRHRLVADIFGEALAVARQGQIEGQAAVLELEVTRFICADRRSRFAFGTANSIRFLLTLRDPLTRAVLQGPDHIEVNLQPPVALADQADPRARALRQRKVIVEGLAQVFRREIAMPDQMAFAH